MGIFTRFLTRELGKNTGKMVSNMIFGDSWATPYKVSVNEKTRRERMKMQKERDAANRITQQKRLQLQQKKARDNEIKLLTKQLERFKTMVEEGYMTRQEFEIAKRNILSKLDT